MSEIIAVTPSTAPTPYSGGHYSPGVVVGGFVFVSGQGPIEPTTNEILTGSIAEQAQLTIDNLQAVLNAAESDLTRIVKATIYLADLADWQVVDRIWAERIGGVPPARCTVGATLLAGMEIEIDVIAVSGT